MVRAIDEFINANKNSKGIGTNSSVLKLNCIHGSDIFGIINKLKNGFKDVVIFASGDDTMRRLDAFGLPYVDIVKEHVQQVVHPTGQVEYKLKGDLPDASLWIMWDVQFIPIELITQMAQARLDPICYIGDMARVDFLGQGKVGRFMRDAIVVDKISKNIPGFSQELVYLSNRIRNGSIDDISKVKNRSYLFTTDKIDLDQLLTYDVCITSKHVVPELNMAIREDLFDYPVEPQDNERMVAYAPCVVLTGEGEKVNVPMGTEFTVLSLSEEIGGSKAYRVLMGEKEFTMRLDMNFIHGMIGSEEYNILAYDPTTVKAFYSYVLPSYLVNDKSYDSVYLQYFPNYGDGKEYLYSMVSLARKNIEVQYSEESSLLF